MAVEDDDGSALGDGIRAGATWIECLGDLARYRMAVEDRDPRPGIVETDATYATPECMWRHGIHDFLGLRLGGLVCQPCWVIY
jgi:hypothetical protein